MDSNISKYSHPNLMISPRKLRILVNEIKPLNPLAAASRLKLTNTKAARLLHRCLSDAIASAKHNYSFDPNSLKFVKITVNEGSKTKKIDKSHGSRFARGIITKRHSRLNIQLYGTKN